MSQGKYSPCRFKTYAENLNNRVQRFKREDFVSEETLHFSREEGPVHLEGQVLCEGGLYIDAEEWLNVISEDGTRSKIQRSGYRYNVALVGVGNVMRYDSPHPTHNQEHHVHRFDIFDDDDEGEVHFIYDVSQTPALDEVIEETRNWYYDNLIEIKKALEKVGAASFIAL